MAAFDTPLTTFLTPSKPPRQPTTTSSSTSNPSSTSKPMARKPEPKSTIQAQFPPGPTTCRHNVTRPPPRLQNESPRFHAPANRARTGTGGTSRSRIECRVGTVDVEFRTGLVEFFPRCRVVGGLSLRAHNRQIFGKFHPCCGYRCMVFVKKDRYAPPSLPIFWVEDGADGQWRRLRRGRRRTRR